MKDYDIRIELNTKTANAYMTLRGWEVIEIVDYAIAYRDPEDGLVYPDYRAILAQIQRDAKK